MLVAPSALPEICKRTLVSFLFVDSRLIIDLYRGAQLGVSLCHLGDIPLSMYQTNLVKDQINLVFSYQTIN